VYGTEPNAFLVAAAGYLPPGPVLSLGEGEGRNAVWLAERGHAVTAVDASAVGMAKAAVLAAERGVALTTVVADLATYAIEPGAWAGIVSIFVHLPRAVRAAVHAAVVQGLRPGGAFILEAYQPRQLDFGTGGPRDPALLVTLDDLRRELTGLEFVVARECEREVVEGRHHTGVAAVVQVVAGRLP
jgi:SAM-dependent methyltransferase